VCHRGSFVQFAKKHFNKAGGGRLSAVKSALKNVKKMKIKNPNDCYANPNSGRPKTKHREFYDKQGQTEKADSGIKFR